MTGFWIGAAFLVVIMLLILIYPGLMNRKSSSSFSRTAQQSVEVFKDRLKELEEEKASGVITAEKFEQIKEELEASLVEDSSDLTEQVVMHHLDGGQKWLLFGSLATIVLLITVTTYGRFGAYPELQEAIEFSRFQPQNQQHATADQINAMVSSLEEKLKESPDNLDGWFLLARSYMNMERYAEAADAYSKTIPLLEKNNENPAAVYGLVAQARYFANQSSMGVQVQEAIDKAFELDPNEPNTLGLLGMIAMQHGEFAKAAESWERILDAYPDHPSKNAIIEGINEARSRLGQPPIAASKVTPPTTAASGDNSKAGPPVSLTMEVTIDDALREKASDSDTLFVYARAVNGPKMPLAIVRKTVADLPLTVTLDDSMAMAPMARLSNFEEVELIARVSKKGTPAPNPGDLEGIITPVKTRGKDKRVYQVRIDRKI